MTTPFAPGAPIPTKILGTDVVVKNSLIKNEFISRFDLCSDKIKNKSTA